MNRKELLKTVRTVLVIDWPSRDVPASLARAGFYVWVRGGPGPLDFSVYEWSEGELVVRPAGRCPESADLIYAYRPLSELPSILDTARQLHPQTVWTQSGLAAEGVRDPKGCWLPEEQLRAARELARSAGVRYVTEPYIEEIVREFVEDRAGSR